MGRHRKSTHSVLWDYVVIWAFPVTGLVAGMAGLIF